MVVNGHDENRASGVALSAVKKDRETGHLQVLKNLEVVLRDSNIGNEGTSYGFKWIAFNSAPTAGTHDLLPGSFPVSSATQLGGHMIGNRCSSNFETAYVLRHSLQNP